MVGEDTPFASVVCSDLGKRITSWFAFSKDLSEIWYVEEDKA